MREIDSKAAEASADETKLSDFITEYEAFILKCISKNKGRYITKSDDEWSVAIKAFYDAVKTYSFDKGSFLHFAELVINRRLIDYARSQGRFRPEFSVDPVVFTGDIDEDENDYSIAEEIGKKTNDMPDSGLKDEIEAAAKQFEPYGFSFYDLADCSPKSQKTKKCCIEAVGFILKNPMLLNEMRAKRNLPLKVIEINTKLPRKMLERHRKYIIAAVEILAGDYPRLAEYMRPFREEQTR